MALFSWYKPESDKYLHLDVLRFIASAAIVLYHYLGAVDPALLEIIGGKLHKLPFAVDMFFVISGVIMFDLYSRKLNSWRDYGVFLRRRFARLGPLHYATLGFFILLGIFAARLGVRVEHAEAFDSACIVPNLLFIQSFGVCRDATFNSPSWSISAEMGMYLLLPLFLWNVRRPLAAWIAFAVLIGLLFAVSRFTPLPWTLWTHDFGVLRAMPSFLFGLLLAASSHWLVRIPAAGTLMGLGLAAFLLESFFDVADIACLFTVYFIVATGLAADRQARSTPIVRLGAPMGRLTYSIYMLHVPVSVIMITVVAKRLMQLEGNALNLAVLVVGVVVLPAVSLVSYLFFETPLREALSGRRRPRAISLSNRPIPTDRIINLGLSTKKGGD